MAKHPRLHKRTGSNNYYFRAKVPVDLQGHYGKKEITYSLRTPDYQKAVEKLHVASVMQDQEFAEVRRTLNAVEAQELSQVEIERLVAIAYHDALKEDEDKRAGGLSRAAHAQYRELVDTMEGELKERYAKGKTEGVEDYARDLLSSQGVGLEQSSADFKTLTVRLLEMLVQANADIRQRLKGASIPTPPKPASMATAVNPYQGDTPTITEIHAMWAKEHLAAGGAEKTVGDFGSHVRRFAELHGDMPVGEITKAHVRDYKDAMLLYPARPTKKLKAMTVPKVLEYMSKNPGIRTLTPRTVNDKAMGAIGAMLGWASGKNGYIEYNPAAGVKVKVAKVQKANRLPYSIDDLNQIFRWPVHTGGKRTKGAAGEAGYWIPLICLFSGARREEIGQLAVEDIKKERGVTYFDMMTMEDGQSRKTESSKRYVPIHSMLIKLGLLEYAERVGSGSLFPDLKTDKHGRFTEAFGKWWGKYLRRNGITDKRKVFHSFRHSVKDAFREGGVEEQYSDAICGHSNKTEGRSYGGGSITRLAKEIEKLEYPGLDLDHLLQE